MIGILYVNVVYSVNLFRRYVTEVITIMSERTKRIIEMPRLITNNANNRNDEVQEDLHWDGYDNDIDCSYQATESSSDESEEESPYDKKK